MAILTKAQFASVTQSMAEQRRFPGIVNKRKNFSKDTPATSIFLSHLQADKAIMEQAKIFFENFDIHIYVNWANKPMSENETGFTNKKIKNQVSDINDKFILLATNDAIVSKQFTLELDIAASLQLPNKKTAFLPLAADNGTWDGNKYLKIYPRIEAFMISGKNQYFVIYPDDTVEKLSAWLNKK